MKARPSGIKKANFNATQSSKKSEPKVVSPNKTDPITWDETSPSEVNKQQALLGQVMTQWDKREQAVQTQDFKAVQSADETLVNFLLVST